MSGAIYFYYSTTQTRIGNLITANSTLVANNGQLTSANQQNLETIDELTQVFEETRQNFERVQTEFQTIREQNNELRQRLGRHELSALAAARPVLVERTINNASRNAARCFELLSGAPLTEREHNATSGRDFNSECPFLWPDSTN